MSCITFVVVKNNKAKYICNHYSAVSNLLQKKYSPDCLGAMSLICENGKLLEWTDTGFNPAVIINYDKKELVNTPFNWFDDFKKYLPKGWTYKELGK